MNDLVNMVVAENIRREREAQKRTQRECSHTLGACESYWRTVEAGKKHISLLRLSEMADVLGVKASNLLEGL